MTLNSGPEADTYVLFMNRSVGCSYLTPFGSEMATVEAMARSDEK